MALLGGCVKCEQFPAFIRRETETERERERVERNISIGFYWDGGPGY